MQGGSDSVGVNNCVLSSCSGLSDSVGQIGGVVGDGLRKEAVFVLPAFLSSATLFLLPVGGADGRVLVLVLVRGRVGSSEWPEIERGCSDTVVCVSFQVVSSGGPAAVALCAASDAVCDAELDLEPETHLLQVELSCSSRAPAAWSLSCAAKAGRPGPAACWCPWEGQGAEPLPFPVLLPLAGGADWFSVGLLLTPALVQRYSQSMSRCPRFLCIYLQP